MTRPFSSPRTRRTTSASSGRPNAGPFVKDGIHELRGAGAHGRREPGPFGHESRGASPGPGRGREEPKSLRLRLCRRGALSADPFAGIRRDLREAPAGGRRVLRRPHAAVRGRGRGPGDAAGAGGDAVDQAVLLLRRRPLARRARRRPLRGIRQGRAQRRMVPHGQRRRDLDARQVGIPVVCRLGSRVPHDRPVAGGRGLRQGASSS